MASNVPSNTEPHRWLSLLTAFVVFIVAGTSVGLWQTYHLPSGYTASNNSSSWSGDFTYERPSTDGIPEGTNPFASEAGTQILSGSPVPTTSTQTPKTSTSVITKNTPTSTAISLPTTPASAGEVCSQRTISFKTTVQYASYLDKGTSYTLPGINGTEYFCTSSSGVKRVTTTIPAYDEIIYTGTHEPFTYTPPQTTLPVTGCNISLRTSYTSQYNSAVQQENQRYSSALADANYALAYMANHGAGSSSAYQQVLVLKAQNEGQHTSTLKSLYSTYQANLASINCS